MQTEYRHGGFQSEQQGGYLGGLQLCQARVFTLWTQGSDLHPILPTEVDGLNPLQAYMYGSVYRRTGGRQYARHGERQALMVDETRVADAM